MSLPCCQQRPFAESHLPIAKRPTRLAAIAPGLSVSRQRHRFVLSLTMMMNVAFKCEWLVESWSLALIDYIGIFGRISFFSWFLVLQLVIPGPLGPTSCFLHLLYNTPSLFLISLFLISAPPASSVASRYSFRLT